MEVMSKDSRQLGVASANARNTKGAAQKWQRWAKTRTALESRALSFNENVLWSDMHFESLKDTWIFQGAPPTDAETTKKIGQTAWEERLHVGGGSLKHASDPPNNACN